MMKSALLYISCINNKMNNTNKNKTKVLHTQARNSYSTNNVCNNHTESTTRNESANTYAAAVKSTGTCLCNCPSKSKNETQQQWSENIWEDDVTSDKNKNYCTSEVSKIVKTLCECPVEALNKIIEILKFIIINLMNESVNNELPDNKFSRLLLDSKNLSNKKKTEIIDDKPNNTITTEVKVDEAIVSDNQASLPVIKPKNLPTKLIEKNKVISDKNETSIKACSANKMTESTKSNDKKFKE